MPQPAPAVVLASASPRRAALLRSVGIEPVIAPVQCDETPRASEPAAAYAQRIAALKLAAALARDREAAPVLVADTVVWQEDGVPLGKPTSREHAAQMIRALTGGPAHHVTTAWAVAWPNGTQHAQSETTLVTMRPLVGRELLAYLHTGEWRDKAGGYGIQGFAGSFVTRIEGSYTNVVGLPLSQVIAVLRDPDNSRDISR